MKKLIFSAICLLLVFSLIAPPALAQDSSPPTNPPLTELAEHVPGELLIRFSPGINSAQVASKMAAMGITPKKEIQSIKVHLVKLPPGLPVAQAVARFNSLPGVEFAEPNYILHIAATNQAEVTDQWGWTKIHTQEAWNNLLATEKNEILLATVDTGINRTQPDLSSRIWYDPNEISGDGIDNDLNGYVDDVYGWDFVNNDNDPVDDQMHGTAVSGVMVAEQNGTGVVGICPWCKVMAVKVLSAQGSGTLDVVASGITYAANKGARVINLSLAGAAGSQTLATAVDFAWGKGVVVVAAAGNDGLETVRYPAAYDNAIAVGSTNSADQHSCFSNFSAGYISVAAPGEAIYVIDINNTTTGYGYYSGTSLSAPHVAGLAGLILGKTPGLTNIRVREIIENTAIDLGPQGVDMAFGYGRIDALRAVLDDESQTTPPDSLSSTSDTASGYAHARKLVRDSFGVLHLIWHTYEGSLYRIRYATSSDNGATWDLQPDVFSSPYESYHPALATDNVYLYVAIPSRVGDGLPYQILFTRKLIAGSSWSTPDSLMGGTANTVRPDIYVDPSNGRLHLIASSLDDSPYLYYRSSDSRGTSWDSLSQINPSNSSSNTRYATIHAYGDNIYVATRTVSNLVLFTYYYLYTARSIDGGATWIDQNQISYFLAFTSGEYGVSLAGVGDRVYMGYEVGSNMYFRRYDGNAWSDYLQLETGGPNNVYKWPTITQASEGQAWMIFQVNKQLYMRHYNGLNWEAKESLGNGTYANLKLGTGGGQVEWVSTTCTGSPFDLAYGSLGISPGPNSPPQADSQDVMTNENTPVNITLTGSDPDGNSLTFNITAGPAHGILSGTAPNLVYTPANDYYGPDSFDFIVNDGLADSLPARVSITVNQANDPPTANPDSLSTPEDTPLAITLTGSDPEGGNLTFSITAGPAHGVLSGTAPNLVYTPANNYYGPDSFDFTVNDGYATSLPAMVSITVNSVNDAPTANPDSLSTLEDTPLAINLTGSDPENDPLTFSIVTYPTHGNLSGAPPNLIYTPSSGFSGSDSFKFDAFDGSDYSLPATVSILVTGTSIHLGDLDAQAVPAPRNRWNARVDITVHDSTHNPVPGVIVNGTWSAGATGSVTCTTDSSGSCFVEKNNLKDNVTSVTFTVDNLSFAALAYNPLANHDPDGDSPDGTTILVYRDGSPANQLPVASFTYGCTGLACDFDATGSSDPDGLIASYTWDFGDGASDSGAITSHTYNSSGAYNVVLTVVDDQGASASNSQQVFLGVTQSMHVSDLDGESEVGIRNRWNASVHILVHNASNAPLAGVSVSGSWSTGAGGSCLTDSSGWCTITLSNIKNTITNVNFSVTDLDLAGWVFDPQANVDPDADSNGTLITIYYP